MRVIILIVFLFFCVGALAQEVPPPEIPRKYDIKQDDRFNNYITADNELARIVEGKVSGIESQLQMITWILTAIGGSIVALIITEIYKKLWRPRE